MKDYVCENGNLYEAEDEEPGVYRWYFTEVMGCCGCYSSDVFKDIMNALLSFDNEKQYCWYRDLKITGDDKYKEFIMHVMTEKDLIEHGSSVRGSWLTGKGIEILKIVKDNS